MEEREREHELSHECVFVSLGVAFVCGDGRRGEGFYDRPTKSIHHPFEIKMIAGPVAERGTDVGGDGGRVGEQDGEEV